MKKNDSSISWLLFLFLALLLLLLPQDVVSIWRVSFFSNLKSIRKYISPKSNKQPLTIEAKRGDNDKESELLDYKRQVEEYRILLLKSQSKLFSVKKSLREVSSLKEYHPNLRYINSRVIYRAYLNISRKINSKTAEVIINKGYNAGLKVGDAALQGQTVIGIISNIANETSTVILINNPRTIIPGRLQNSRKECYIRGLDNGKIEAVFLGNKPTVNVGDIIFTSGLLGTFPQNLLIGEINSKPKLSKNKKTYVCELRPSADIYAIENILIIKRATNDYH